MNTLHTQGSMDSWWQLNVWIMQAALATQAQVALSYCKVIGALAGRSERQPHPYAEKGVSGEGVKRFPFIFRAHRIRGMVFAS